MMRDNITKLMFIISIFLYEASDMLLLFSLPVFIFFASKSILLTSVIMILRPIGMGFSYMLFKNRLQDRNFVFLLLLGYSIAFIVVILFNRFLSFPILVLSVLLLGIAKQLVSTGVLKIEYDKTGFSLGSFKKFLMPSTILASVSILLIIGDLNSEYQFSNLQNYYSLLLSISAVLFYYSICKRYSTEKQRILFPKAVKLLSINKSEIDLKLLLIESIKGVIFVLFPIYISANIYSSSELVYLIPSFFTPIMLLHILRNSKIFKYWKVRTLPILIVISIILSLFVLIKQNIHFIILVFLLGSCIGLIEVSSSYIKERGDYYVKGLRSSTMGFILGVLVGGFAYTYFTIPVMFSIFGIILLGFIIIKKVFPLKIEIISS